MTMDAFGDLRSLLSTAKGDDAAPERPVVVVVDDDDAIRDGLRILLEDSYNLLLCASAEEGVDAMNDNVCAVVLDVKMPGQDGFWACTEIHKKLPNVPVIFYSAYQNVKDPYRIINEHYPFGYMDKGSDVQALIEKIAKAVTVHMNAVASRKQSAA